MTVSMFFCLLSQKT